MPLLSVLALIAFVLSFVIGHKGSNAVDRGMRHVRPEHQGRSTNGAFWTLDRFTTEGQRELKHGWKLLFAAAALYLAACAYALTID
jgi:hypothetical protein